ncbi:MAG: hypothetical protein ABR607_16870 [Pyrinomonadaceae bacterium]
MNLTIAFLLCLSGATCWGQTPPPGDMPPGIAIRKYKWEKVGAGPSVDSTFKAENDSPSGNTSDSSTPAQASGLRDRDTPFFMYSVELRNDGGKAIKAVLWNYLIIDGATNEELGRHEFVSFEKVSSNAVRALTVRSRLSPSRIVTVQGSQPSTTTIVERVILKCVVYDDGTLWQQPGLTAQNCESLRRRVKSN